VTTAALILGGYLLGSMPWGYWLVRLFRHEDIREHGSGNIGGTNVWRVYGRRLGAPVVFMDTAKGFVAALVAYKIAGPGAGVLAGAGAMLGHFRPLFLRFQRGGKMVATCGGAFLGLAPLVFGVGLLVWLVVFLLFRYASLASIAAAIALPMSSWLLGDPWQFTAFAAAAAVAVIVLHRANIGRLVHGKENRFQLRRPKGRGPAAPASVRD
jgi:glycerol-3-phosphate acyltransferase PlsY